MSCYLYFSMIERRTDDKATQSDTSNMIDVQFEQTKELDKKSRYLKASGRCISCTYSPRKAKTIKKN